MSYTLEQFSGDCHAALAADPGPGGREVVRQCVARACKDPDFVATWLKADGAPERRVIYEDPEFGFCILAHVYSGPKTSDPHDHASTWAIYGQADGVTMMTDWKVLERPADGRPGRVEAARTYRLEPGDAHVYQEGDVHSPRRDGPTRLIRIEGMKMDGVERDKFVAA